MKHAPPDYRCPFCAIVRGIEAPYVHTAQAEVVLRDSRVTAFIASNQWPNNPGHVLVVPNEHYENLYGLPDALAAPLQSAARRIALAFKAEYNCPETSTRQHNEPAGNQDVWHYHLHVFPRYENDALYGRPRLAVAVEARLEQAARIRERLESPAVPG